jgi:hypothetical protein
VRVLFVLFAALMLTGCTTTVAGVPAGLPPSARCQLADLMTCVMPAPTGSKPDDDLGLGPAGVLTLKDYIAKVADPADVAAATAYYSRLGLGAVAHRGWSTVSLYSDMVLMDFATPAGAAADTQAHAAEVAGDKTQTKASLDGVPSSVVTYYGPPDDDHITLAEVIGCFHGVEMRLIVSSTVGFDQPAVAAWVRSQIDFIR